MYYERSWLQRAAVGVLVWGFLLISMWLVYQGTRRVMHRPAAVVAGYVLCLCTPAAVHALGGGATPTGLAVFALGLLPVFFVAYSHACAGPPGWAAGVGIVFPMAIGSCVQYFREAQAEDARRRLAEQASAKAPDEFAEWARLLDDDDDDDAAAPDTPAPPSRPTSSPPAPRPARRPPDPPLRP